MGPGVLVCAQRGRGHILRQNRAVLFVWLLQTIRCPCVPKAAQATFCSKTEPFFSCGCSKFCFALHKPGKILLILQYQILFIKCEFSLGQVPISRSPPFFSCVPALTWTSTTGTIMCICLYIGNAEGLKLNTKGLGGLSGWKKLELHVRDGTRLL